MWKLAPLVLLIASVGVSVASAQSVVFAASLETSPPAITSNTPVIFNKLELNYGQGYDGNTGVFTVPMDGAGWTGVGSNTRILELIEDDEVNVVLYYTITTSQQINCSSWKNCVFSGALID